MPYSITGYTRFDDADGYPAVAPPWGTLNAIDLNTGKYLWKLPLGEYPELAAKGLKNTGTENYGGPDCDCRGIVDHCRHRLRPQDPGVQQPHGRIVMGSEASILRRGHPGHLYG